MYQTLTITAVWFCRIGAILSILSSIILVNLVFTKKRKRKVEWKELHPKNHIILMTGFIELIGSVALLTSTSAFPKESGVYGAVGNASTCVAQGFMVQMGLAVPLYSASLSLSYWLVICQTSSKTPLHYSKKFFHIVPIGVSIATAIACLFLDIIEPRNSVCYIGEQYSIWILCFAGVIVWSSFLIILFCMMSVFLEVRKRNNRMLKHSFSLTMNVPTKTDKRLITEKVETAKQAFMSIFLHLLVYLFPTLQWWYTMAGQDVPHALYFISSTIYPLRGFLNFFVLTRPMIFQITRMQEKGRMTLFSAYRNLIFDPGPLVSSQSRLKSKSPTPRKHKKKSDDFVRTGTKLDHKEKSTQKIQADTRSSVSQEQGKQNRLRGAFSQIFGSSIGDGDQTAEEEKGEIKPNFAQNFVHFNPDEITTPRRMPRQKRKRRVSLIELASIMSEEEEDHDLENFDVAYNDLNNNDDIAVNAHRPRYGRIQLSEATRLSLLELDNAMSCSSDVDSDTESNADQRIYHNLDKDEEQRFQEE
jgi:hypothetical protein